MTEQEKIEICRKEFCQYYKTKRCTNFFEGQFLDWRTDLLFEGWKAAKRSQPIVKLPKDYGNGKVEMGLVKKSLTAAGIRFEVEE